MIPKRFQNDEGYVRRAVRRDASTLQHASKRLQSDPSIVLAAIEKKASSIQFASKKIRSDRKFMVDAVCKHGCSVVHISDQLKNNKQFWLDLVARGFGDLLDHAPEKFKNDRAMMVAANKTRSGNSPIRENTIASYNVPFTSPQLNDDREVAFAAMKLDHRNLQYASKRLRNDWNFMLEAVRCDGRSVGYISKQLWNNKRFWIAAIGVSNASILLHNAPENLKSDEEFVRVAMDKRSNCEAAVEFASHRFKNNRKFMLDALFNHGDSAAFASDRLKNDESFWIAAVARGQWTWNCCFLRHVPENLLNNKKFVFNVVKKDSSCLRSFPYHIQSDVAVVVAALDATARADFQRSFPFVVLELVHKNIKKKINAFQDLVKQ